MKRGKVIWKIAENGNNNEDMTVTVKVCYC